MSSYQPGIPIMKNCSIFASSNLQHIANLSLSPRPSHLPPCAEQILGIKNNHAGLNLCTQGRGFLCQCFRETCLQETLTSLTDTNLRTVSFSILSFSASFAFCAIHRSISSRFSSCNKRDRLTNLKTKV